MKKYNHGFSERLKQRRIQLGLGQTQFAKMLGHNYNAGISSYESGKREPSMCNIAEIAFLLECCPAWLAFGIGKKPKPKKHCETCKCFLEKT